MAFSQWGTNMSATQVSLLTPLFSLLVGLAGTAVAQADAPASSAGPPVQGSVVEADGGAPISGAGIALYRDLPGSAVGVGGSILNGTFVVRAPGPGDFRLVVGAVGRQPAQYSVRVPAAGLAGILIRLQHAPQILVSIMQGDDDATGPVQVWIAISTRDREPVRPFFLLRTGGDQVLRLCDAPWADYRLPQYVDIAARVHGVGVTRVRIPGWPTTPIDLNLAMGVRISGKVQDADGHGIPGASVCVMPSPPGSQWPIPDRLYTQTGEDGNFEATALPPGRYTVSADGGAAGRAVQGVDAVKADAAVVLSCGARVEAPVPTSGPAPDSPPWRK